MEVEVWKAQEDAALIDAVPRVIKEVVAQS